ncbi:MAG: hypothetical protein ACREJ6_05085 [Candidatus Methylomirabilis sp.]
MLPKTKALLAFAARFLLIFFSILPLWFVFAPPYNRLLASGVNVVLEQIEQPRVTTLVGWGRNIAIVRADAPFTRRMRFQGFTGYLTHFNVILLVALVLATRQVQWRRRLKLLGIALGLLYILHVVYLLVGVRFFERPHPGGAEGAPGSLYVWGVNFYLSIVSQLVPILIWMVLYRSINPIPQHGSQTSQEEKPDEAETT